MGQCVSYSDYHKHFPRKLFPLSDVFQDVLCDISAKNDRGRSTGNLDLPCPIGGELLPWPYSQPLLLCPLTVGSGELLSASSISVGWRGRKITHLLSLS